ncbi:MAG: hypothetical protein AAFO74_12970 [Pseudomonadota bacterium]
MSFYGDFEGALWAIATGTSGKADCDNAQIMRGIAQEALGTAWTDYLNHQKGAKEAFGKVIELHPKPSQEAEGPAEVTREQVLDMMAPDVPMSPEEVATEMEEANKGILEQFTEDGLPRGPSVRGFSYPSSFGSATAASEAG